MFKKLCYSMWTKGDIKRWDFLPNVRKTNFDMDSIMQLAAHCAQFNGEQYQYILISGSNQDYSSETADYLARIPWKGVVSLSRKPNETLYTSISQSKLLRNLIISQKDEDVKNNICHGAAWWMFADGIMNDPDTCFDSFPSWRNKTKHFIEYSIACICATTSPRDLKIIIDIASLSDDDRKKVTRILENFDYSESTIVEVAELICDDQRYKCLLQELEQIKIMRYFVSMINLAQYAAMYLGPIRTKGVWLPHIDHSFGVQIGGADERFICTYVEVVGDHLLNNASAFEAKHSFFWGEAISWDAIEEGIPVERPEHSSYLDMIKKCIQNERWGHISVGHTPGAGATILCRSVLWQLRSSYPVVRIIQLGTDASEALRRIYACSGLPLVILIDGDFSYLDVETLESFLKSALIKYIILYTYRCYPIEVRTAIDESNRDSSKYLTILDSVTAERFESHYCDEIEQKCDYTKQQITERKQNLRSLTTDQSLLEFRMPFFYGMYAFEEDFVSINDYTNHIIKRMEEKTEFCKVISYIAIITYFTAKEGLSGKIAKKIMKENSKSTNQLLKDLNKNLPNFIYVLNNAFRICHPVIARKVLLDYYGNSFQDRPLSSSKFATLCTSFIADVRNIDGGGERSEYVNNLISDIFISRGSAEVDDAGKDLSRKSFSSIILELSIFGLQKKVFQALVQNFPKNPHCFQHYGRLLINNNPNDLVTAREQFNTAIQLDAENPLHFHARGDMYYKYCKNLLETKYKGNNITPQEIFDGCKEDVVNAINDFERAAEISTRHTTTDQSYPSFKLAYPYSSILNICTTIIAVLQKHYKLKYGTDNFWEQDLKYVLWCRKLLAIANRYHLSADVEHPEVIEDHFYIRARERLVSIKCSDKELQNLIKRRKNDSLLKIIYLGRTNTKRDALKKKSQEELTRIYTYCQEVLTDNASIDGALLWKWFNSYILTNIFDRSYAIGFIESFPDSTENLTATYLLYVLYFCQFCNTELPADAEKSLQNLTRCKDLSKRNPQRISSKLFMAENTRSYLTTNRTESSKCACTITEEVTHNQSAMMTLDKDPRFKVFFVPVYNKVVKPGQGFNMSVNAVIGFSYSGLRGFELEIRESKTPLRYG